MNTKINYKIIDNIPQKTNNMDIIKINQLIEGFDTVQNTLENIDSTNKYDLEKNQEQIPIIIKYDDVIKNKYMVLIDGNNEEQEQEKEKEIKTHDQINYKNQPMSKMNNYTSFYVGSLTIVGLFIFYRFIQKTK